LEYPKTWKVVKPRKGPIVIHVKGGVAVPVTYNGSLKEVAVSSKLGPLTDILNQATVDTFTYDLRTYNVETLQGQRPDGIGFCANAQVTDVCSHLVYFELKIGKLSGAGKGKFDLYIDPHAKGMLKYHYRPGSRLCSPVADSCNTNTRVWLEDRYVDESVPISRNTSLPRV
jgi:hypothetical protein